MRDGLYTHVCDIYHLITAVSEQSVTEPRCARSQAQNLQPMRSRVCDWGHSVESRLRQSQGLLSRGQF